MTNVVEIVVTGKNLTKPEFDKAVADARTTGSRIGEEISKGAGEQVSKQLPAKIKEPFDKIPAPAKESGAKTGTAFVSAFNAEIGSKIDPIAGLTGGKAGSSFSAKFSEEARKGITTGSLAAALGPAGVEALAKTSGDRSGFDFTDAMGGRVRADLPAKIEKPLEDSGRKAGQKAGSAAGGALSPLIMAAFAGVATAGPGLILAGAATAVLGVGALITKNNAQLANSYKMLGADASAAITDATAPLVPALQASVQVLDAGIGKVGPQLKDVFAAVAPDATALTGGLVSLVSNILPGLSTGLRAIAPYAHEIADDFGKLGTGAGNLFSGLAGGAGGGVAGFSALIDTVSHLLGDIGQLTGALANGLGPALHDISTVVIPVVDGVAKFVSSLNPTVIRAAADATAALFVAFKAASLAGLLAEGTTFLAFLKGAATGEVALAGETGTLAGATAGLGAAFEALTGPVGLLVASIPLLTGHARDMGLAMDDSKGKVVSLGGAASDQFGTMLAATDGMSRSAKNARDNIDNLVGTFKDLKDHGADISGAIEQIDVQLARLVLSNPTAGTSEYANVIKDLGLSAKDAAAQFPQYNAAISSGAEAVQGLADHTAQALSKGQLFQQQLVVQQEQLAATGKDAGIAAVALLDLGVSQAGLSSALADGIDEYQGAVGAANAYEQVLQSLNGETISLYDSTAKYTIALDGVARSAKANGTSLDDMNAKGAQNVIAFTQLAQEADRAAGAVYESEVNSKGATQAFADANDKLRQEKDAFIEAAVQAGFNRKKVQELADALFKLPDKVPVDVTLNTKPALQQLNGLIQRIDESSGTVQIYGSTNGVLTAGGRALGANAHGGIVGAVGMAATGGPRGNLTLAGEHGIELLDLAPGTRVHSNPDTQRMLAQAASGGGGVATVVLEVAGNSEDWLVQALRHAVRVRGGNGANSVQVVLGQSF